MPEYAFIKLRDRLTLLVFPLILTWINSNWVFTPVTDFIPDPWFYLGYFRYFYEYAPVFPSNTHYFVERLTWIIPGHLIHKVFSPLSANYVLHLFVYYIAVFSLYGILNLLFSSRTGLMSALFMGGYPWFLRAAGWDYPDGAGISHVLLFLFLITLAQHSDKWRLYILMAGVVHSSLAITHLFWVSFFPCWMIYFLILNHKTKSFGLRQFVLAGSYFFIGSLVTVAIMALLYYKVTGEYFFLSNSLRFSFSLTADEVNRKGLYFLTGHLRPYWHFLSALVGLASTLRMLSHRHPTKNLSFTAVYLLFLAVHAWLTGWHLYSTPVLIVFSYSSFAIPVIFLLLGGLLDDILYGVTEKDFSRAIITIVGLLLLPFLILYPLPEFERLQGNIILLLIVSLVLLSLLIVIKNNKRIFSSIIVITILFFLVGESSYVYVPDSHKGKSNFMAIIIASQTIDEYFPNRSYDEFRLWFREDENYDTFFSLASLYLYPWGSALGKPYSRGPHPSQLTLVESDILQKGDNVVIISSNSQSNILIDEANRSASDQGVKFDLVTIKRIKHGSVRFFLYFTNVNSLP